MKIMRSLALAAIVTLTVTLLFQIAVTPAAAAENQSSRDDKRKLRLRVYFERFAGPAVAEFGDQFTIGGSVARFETPNQRIGSLGLHFVVTAPHGAETMLTGMLNLPDGQISFSGFSTAENPRAPGPITGGTGAYSNARGQLDHQTLAGGVEEFIITFVGN